MGRMRTGIQILMLVAAILSACAPASQTEQTQAVDDFSPDQIIGLERGALDRWSKGDPGGYLELYADDITYFDPTTAARLDGIEAMRASLEPMTGKVNIERYEMVNPRVQRFGDAAVLSFNLTTVAGPVGEEPREVRWNTTEVYARVGGTWKIVHNHWSYTQPQLAGAPEASSTTQ